MANTNLDYTQYTEAVVGRNHPTLTDTDNRALREVLSRSGYQVDQPFRGFPIGSSMVNAGSSDYTGTPTQRVTAAVADAVAASIGFCFVPLVASDGTTMTGFSGATFNSTVHMVREGGRFDTWDVHAYGAAGDGVTDDRVAINAADAGCAPGGTVSFGAGKTYALTTLSAANSLKVNNAQHWDLNGSTIKYTGTTNVTTGADGGAIALVAVLRSPFSIRFGGLDGNSHVAWLLGVQGALTGPFLFEFITIQNTLEASSAWNGIAYTVSQDQSGVAISGARAQNISGFITRPSCPVVDQNNNITSHQNITALVIGGSATWGNATGFAIIAGGGAETIQFIQTNGNSKGVLNFLSNAGTLIQNTTLLDIGCYDLGTRHQERYGAVLDVPQRQTFSSPGAYTPGWLENGGASDSLVHVITVSANVAVTINNPSNSAAISVDRVGRIWYFIRNTSGAGLTTPVSFTGAAYKVTGTVSPGNNQQIAVCVAWDQTTGNYAEMFRGAATGF